MRPVAHADGLDGFGLIDEVVPGLAGEGTKTFGIDKGSSLLAAQSLLKIANLSGGAGRSTSATA